MPAAAPALTSAIAALTGTGSAGFPITKTIRDFCRACGLGQGTVHVLPAGK